MDVDEVWQVIDEQRTDLCDLLASLSPEQWKHPSLCAGWRVRDVAAHLTLSHAGAAVAVPGLLRAGFNFNRMVDRTARARAAALTNEEIIACIRSFVGSRKHAFATTHIEPLLDILVHGQDIARPLGIARPMPVEAAAVAASRAWDTSFPWWSRRKFAGYELIADDVDWRRGTGKEVTGPISEILVAITGRPAGRVALTGLSV